MLSPQKAGKRIARQQRSFGAFTLVELLVVLGMVVIVSVMLVPALAATKPNSKVAQCLNDKRQLTLAWQMYAADNSDSILSCITWIQAGSFQTSSYMDWTSSSRNTNTDALTNPTNALIARYVKSAAIFKCPGDYYQSSAQSVIGPRVRSVSLNVALGGSPTLVGPAPGGGSYISCKKMSDLAKPGPAAVFAFLDEHPDSINDGVFSLRSGFSTRFRILARLARKLPQWCGWHFLYGRSRRSPQMDGCPNSSVGQLHSLGHQISWSL